MYEFSEEFFEIILEIQKDWAYMMENDIEILEEFGIAR